MSNQRPAAKAEPEPVIPAPDAVAPAEEEVLDEGTDAAASEFTDLFQDELEEGGFAATVAEKPAAAKPKPAKPEVEESDEADTTLQAEPTEVLDAEESSSVPVPQKPAQPEVTPPTAAEQVPPTQPQQPQVDPEESRRRYQAQRQQLEQQLTEGYKMSAEDAERFLTEPEAVLPALAARLHLGVMESLWQGAMAQLPGIVGAIVQQRQSQTTDEDAFFTRWPALKGHRDQVTRVAAIWRSMNPQAPYEQAIEEIGTQASMLLKLPLEGVNAPIPQQPATPPRPPRPAVRGAGGRPPAPKPTEPPNPFTQMANDFLAEDI